MRITVLPVYSCCHGRHCATKAPAPEAHHSLRSSEAYQYALGKAFEDAHNAAADRSPASDDEYKLSFTNRLNRVERFDVEVVPVMKRMSIFDIEKSKTEKQMSKIQTVTGTAFHYRFTRHKEGACALGERWNLVDSREAGDCLQFEVRPVDADYGQFIRLFMNADFRAYGISYHEPASGGGFGRAVRVIKWDPDEPLSAESLTLSRENRFRSICFRSMVRTAFKKLSRSTCMGAARTRGSPATL